MKILITTFEPFGGEVLYASREAVKLLPEQTAGRGESGMALEKTVRGLAVAVEDVA